MDRSYLMKIIISNDIQKSEFEQLLDYNYCCPVPVFPQNGGMTYDTLLEHVCPTYY